MEEYLDDTVDEVKKNIRHAEDVDYEDLLEAEKNGKDRKTIKEFLEHKIETEEEEQEQQQEEVEEELVEEIEEETEEGFLGGFAPPQILAGGALAGVLVGLVLGAVLLPGMGGGGDDVGPAAAQSTVEELLTASGSNATVGQAEKVNGLYRVNLSQQVTQGNQTTTQTQSYYLTLDGEKLIPSAVQSAFGQPRPVVLDVQDIRENIQRQQEQAQNQTETTTQ
jgi:hypothetical protein